MPKKSNKQKNKKPKIAVGIADEQDLRPIDQAIADRLMDAVRVVAEDFGYEEGEISIAVMDDAAIRQLNHEYLDHDWATDVITFPLEDEDSLLEGEIIVSRETADRESANHPWSGDDELLLYVIHGMLHLVGYDDTDDEARAEMKAAERDYLVRFKVTGAEKHQDS
jgi:probable rRNA maturation factor